MEMFSIVHDIDYPLQETTLPFPHLVACTWHFLLQVLPSAAMGHLGRPATRKFF